MLSVNQCWKWSWLHPQSRVSLRNTTGSIRSQIVSTASSWRRPVLSRARSMMPVTIRAAVVARCASSRRARAAISWSVLAASSTTASRPATRSATMRTADGHPYLQLLRAPAPHPPRIRRSAVAVQTRGSSHTWHTGLFVRFLSLIRRFDCSSETNSLLCLMTGMGRIKVISPERAVVRDLRTGFPGPRAGRGPRPGRWRARRVPVRRVWARSP